MLVFALIALSVRSGIAIAEHGVGGWLRGDAGDQTEWEVRATVALATLILAVLISGLGYFGDLSVSRWRDWRLVRATRRERGNNGT